MPHFYFDVRDRSGEIYDEEGLEFGSLETAEQDAMTSLAEMARDAFSKGSTGTLEIDVRDASGDVRLTATITLDVIRLAPKGSRRRENRVS